jgi:hypothetical protein
LCDQEKIEQCQKWNNVKSGTMSKIEQTKKNRTAVVVCVMTANDLVILFIFSLTLKTNYRLF